MSSSRTDLLKHLATEAGKLQTGGGYLVKRGAINWVTFPWEQYARGMAIMQDEGSLFNSPVSIGREGTFSIEAFMKIPPVGLNGPLPEIEDDALQSVIDDIALLIEGLGTAMLGEYQVVFRLDRSSVSFVEAHDTELQVQGIVVSFNAVY